MAYDINIDPKLQRRLARKVPQLKLFVEDVSAINFMENYTKSLIEKINSGNYDARSIKVILDAVIDKNVKEGEDKKLAKESVQDFVQSLQIDPILRNHSIDTIYDIYVNI